MHELPKSKVVVLISANTEWEALCSLLILPDRRISPFGEWFELDWKNAQAVDRLLFLHGGWGKISAAASTQYVMDKCSPELIVNIGTCGGFRGEIEKGTIVLVERTIVYDILEQMGDYDDHIASYTTDLDLTWLKRSYPHEVRQTVMVSGDRDLLPQDIDTLKTKYGASAGDWESGAIAWVCQRNGTKCLILRGVTDLVGGHGGEAYDGKMQLYVEKTAEIMKVLFDQLPDWIDHAI